MSSIQIETFNASITVTDLLMKTLENASRDLAVRCIEQCASKYGFDSAEAVRILGLQNMTLIRKEMAKRTPKAQKEKRVEKKEAKFPFPFVASEVQETGCQGLAFNRGLFTQCSKKQLDNKEYCVSCQSEADKNASGLPDCGCIKDRLASGLYEYKDSKGRSPVLYVKVLEKLKLTVEQAKNEAGKKNINIDDAHFEVSEKKKIVKEKSVRGRPKKQVNTVESVDVTDMFAKLSIEVSDESVEELVDEQETQIKITKKSKISEEEKALKKAEMEKEREEKKAQREAKLAQEKAEREEKRQSEIAEKKAQREAKLAQEKAEREAKLAQEKAEREAKRAQEKEKSTKKPSTKASKKQEPVVEKKSEQVAPVQTNEKVKVSRIQIDGKMYLKSGANILYDETTKEEVGLYDPETKSIKPLPEEDEEEEEEDYDSEEEE
jgi:hypothetical protein